MNYGVMHEFAIDSNSSQFKAPFDQIKNRTHVETYKDTAVITPNSDTPYSLVWIDLRAEPIEISMPAVNSKRYYSVSSATATPTITAISAAARLEARWRLHGGRA